MLKRWVIQTGIIAAGAVVAVGTLRRDSPITRAPLIQQLSAGDSAARAKMSSLMLASAPTSPTVSSSSLDRGIDHPRIDYWVTRLSTTMASGFKTSLDRMEKYADMIGAKLDDKSMPKDLIYLALI